MEEAADGCAAQVIFVGTSIVGAVLRRANFVERKGRVQLIVETENNNRNSIRVESKHLPRKSALRHFDFTGRNVSAELESWYSQTERRAEELRKRFAHLLVPKNGGAR